LFGKWIDYGKSHHKGKKFLPKGAWSGSRNPFKILNPFNISGMDEATLFNKFGKWIDYGKSHPRGKKISSRKGRGLGYLIVLGIKPC